MAVKRLTNLRIQYTDGNQNLANGYRLFFYAASSSTKQNTYNSSLGVNANLNPIVLNALGESPVEIWLTVGLTYKVGLAIPGTDDPPASFVWSEDVVAGINDASVTLDQWIASGIVPTFVDATHFTLPGDQTTEFHVGRRLKFSVNAGTVYGRITVSVFGAATTVTMVMDGAQVLDVGLSAVSLGLLTATNNSFPDLIQAGAGISKTFDANGRPVLSTSFTPPQVTQGRVTLVTGVPVVSAPATSGANTVYFTPYGGNQVELYDPVAGTWSLTTFTEVSQLTTDATKSPAAVGNNLNYDMFAWSDAGTFRCTRGPSWVAGAVAGSAVLRGTGAGSTELELFQGRYVNKNAITNGPVARAGLYVGSIQSNGTATIDDTATIMGVWNLFNQVERVLRNTFSANRATVLPGYSEMNTEIRLTPLLGLAIAPVRIWTNGSYQNAAAAFKSAAVAIDSATVAEPGFEVQDANASTGGTNTLGISSEKTGLLGSHFVTILGAINAGTLTMATATVVNTSAKVYLNASTPA